MLQELKAYDELDYRNLSDAVFIKLKEEILNATLNPGQRLQQVELSKKYGISRAPIRDALLKLEAEGFVTVTRKGAVVSSIDADEVQEIYEIRGVLEDLAARKAIPAISDEDLIALTDLVEKMEQASRQGDLSSWLQFNFKFHTDSYKHCNSPNLLKMIIGLWNSTHHYRRAYLRLPGRIERAEKTHRAMLAALAARDTELYRRLIKEHMSEIVREMRELALTRSSMPPKSL